MMIYLAAFATIIITFYLGFRAGYGFADDKVQFKMNQLKIRNRILETRINAFEDE